MNASFSILQKLKNQFFQSVQNKNDYHVAFAPFAFTMSTDDFFFLKNSILTGPEAKKYLKEESEFSVVANSVLRKPHIWNIDNDSILFNLYKNILDTGMTIDPDKLTQEETDKVAAARAVMYNADGTDSAAYTKYKSYAAKKADVDRALIDLNIQKNSIAASDTGAMDKWNIDFQAKNNELKELQIEWQVNGFKSAIDSAKTTFNNVFMSKTAFVEKWTDARNSKLASPNRQTDEFGVDFLVTTCIPNAICDYQSPIWKKVSISKQEIAQLVQTFTQEIPASVLAEFGNLEPELDSIAFEYCILDIQRPWFDEGVINNKFWKYADSSALVSSGDDSMTGQIPAYPVKIVLSKNIELAFTPNAAVNEDIKNKLKSGTRLFFGSLMLKTIPVNLANDRINTFKVQQLSNSEMTVLTKVAAQDSGATTKINEGNKFRNFAVLKQQVAFRRTMEIKSVRPTTEVAKTNIAMVTPPVKVATMQATTVTPAIRRTDFATMQGARTFTPMVITHMPPPVIIATPPRRDIPPPPPPPVSTKSDITGKVMDITNQPVPVAEVQLMNVNNAATQSVLTLDDGTFSLQNIQNDRYQVKVKKTGYVTEEKTIDIRNNMNVDFLLQAEPIPVESFQLMAVICKKLPKLPDPMPGATYQ